MPWVRLDDGFDEHPKIAALSDPAYRLFTSGLCYCNRNLTDGFIPWSQARRIHADWEAAALALEECGLWSRGSGGWQVHDYSEYQPSRSSVLAEREAAKERMRAARSTNKERSSGEVRANIGRSSANPDPDPDPVSGSESDPKETPLSPSGDVRVPKSRAKRNGVPEGFEDFYGPYPRHDARADAEKAYVQMGLDADPDLRARAVGSIPRLIVSGCLRPGRTPDGRSTVPLPASFIRGKRWEDRGAGSNGDHLETLSACGYCGDETGTCTHYPHGRTA